MKPENLNGRFSEEWIRLMDDKIPEGEYAVASLIQDSSGVRVLPDSGGHKVRIIFDGFPLLVQSSEEGLRMRTWGNVQRKYKDRFIFRKAVLFEVKNSSLVKWCVQESCGFYQEQKLRHYCIAASDELIDIVSTFEPEIEAGILEKK